MEGGLGVFDGIGRSWGQSWFRSSFCFGRDLCWVSSSCLVSLSVHVDLSISMLVHTECCLRSVVQEEVERGSGGEHGLWFPRPSEFPSLATILPRPRRSMCPLEARVRKNTRLGSLHPRMVGDNGGGGPKTGQPAQERGHQSICLNKQALSWPSGSAGPSGVPRCDGERRYWTGRGGSGPMRRAAGSFFQGSVSFVHVF